LGKFNIHFWSGGTRIFGVEKFEKTLLEVIKRGNITTHYKTHLVEIDGTNKKARFEYLDGDRKGESDWMEFEMIELTEILSQLEGPKMSISLCFNYELRNDPRIKAFKDFMIKEAEAIS